MGRRNGLGGAWSVRLSFQSHPPQAYLIEVNANPAVAADLMANMCEDLVALTIDPLFPLPEGTAASNHEAAEKARVMAQGDVNSMNK